MWSSFATAKKSAKKMKSSGKKRSASKDKEKNDTDVVVDAAQEDDGYQEIID